MAESSGIVDDKKIYDLTEIYEERSSLERNVSDGRNSQEVIVIDGRGYERIKQEKKIHELTDIVEDHPAANNLHQDVAAQVQEIAERIARELIPDIAERVIREEILKLNRTAESTSTKIN
jgi:hypothetical protein